MALPAGVVLGSSVLGAPAASAMRAILALLAVSLYWLLLGAAAGALGRRTMPVLAAVIAYMFVEQPLGLALGLSPATLSVLPFGAGTGLLHGRTYSGATTPCDRPASPTSSPRSRPRPPWPTSSWPPSCSGRSALSDEAEADTGRTNPPAAAVAGPPGVPAPGGDLGVGRHLSVLCRHADGAVPLRKRRRRRLVCGLGARVQAQASSESAMRLRVRFWSSGMPGPIVVAMVALLM
ncbi:hypothetical protein GCM10025883_26230 [Mobilicoccus caccae]|uniref:Uncharacterized protein n=1 Tax=Mobilicoccus caccae TaxID=1859295 RepID=A0ABQ6IV73_9MICO|nr:hypothetical protein GCM10025883_26230 [Mobilicoccus caccae]